MRAFRIKAFDISRCLVAVAASLLALVAIANSAPTPTPTPTSTPTPGIGPIADNSTGTGSVASSSLLSNEPVLIQTGHFLLTVAAIHGTGASTATMTAPSGWTLIPISGAGCNSGSGSEVQLAAAYRVATGVDGPSTTLTWDFSSAFLGSVVNTVFDGVDSATPLDVIGATTCVPGSAGGAIPASAITTTRSNDLIMGLFAAAGSSQSVSLPSGSVLHPIVSQNNFGSGPAEFNGFVLTASVSPSFGAPGTYGPYAATQLVAGESVGVSLSVGALLPTATPTPTPTPTATPTRTATPTPSPTSTPHAIATGTAPIRISGSPGSTVNGGTFRVCDVSGGQMTTSSVTISFDNADLFTSATLTGTEGANTVTATVVPETGGDSPEHTNSTIFNFSPLIIPLGECASFSLSVTITPNPAITMRRTPVVYASLIAVSEPGSNGLGVPLGVIALLSLCIAAAGGARRRRTTIAVILFLASLATQIGCDTGGLPASLSQTPESTTPQSTQTVMKVDVVTQTGTPVPVRGVPVKISTVLAGQ